jgi:hypothetical protein
LGLVPFLRNLEPAIAKRTNFAPRLVNAEVGSKHLDFHPFQFALDLDAVDQIFFDSQLPSDFPIDLRHA